MKRILMLVGLMALAASSTTYTSFAATNIKAGTAKAALCPVTLSRTQYYAISDGEFIDVQVTAAGYCNWEISYDPGWISVTKGQNGYGNGTITFMTWANLGGSRRTQTVTVNDQTITFIQPTAFSDVPSDHQFYYQISKLHSRGIVAGCGTFKYCPDAVVTREQLATILIRTLGMFDPPVPSEQRFSDVPPARSSYRFVDQLFLRGITAGCDSGLFCPERTVTREQLAIFLARALGVPNPPPPAAPLFTDVSPARVGYAHIDEVARRGLMLGYGDGRFGPDDPVSRAQLAAILYRAFNLY